MKKNKLKLLVMAGVLAVGSLISISTNAAAMGYDEDVPGLNGFVGVYGSKYYDAGNGYVFSTAIGGNYKLDTRMFQNGKGTSWKRIDDNTYVSWTLTGFFGNKTYGANVLMHLSTDLITPVRVNATGVWDAN